MVKHKKNNKRVPLWPNSKLLLTIIIAFVLAIIALGWIFYRQRETINMHQQEITYWKEKANDAFASPKDVDVEIYTVDKNDKVTNPLLVIGRVPGNWAFEGSFSVLIKDDNGNICGESIAILHGDWMTEDLVPFSTSVTYSGQQTKTGTLVIQKENASGLPEHDDEVIIPIKF